MCRRLLRAFNSPEKMFKTGSCGYRVVEAQVKLQRTNRSQVALDSTIRNGRRQVQDEQLKSRLGHRKRRTGMMKESDRGAKLKELALARGI